MKYNDFKNELKANYNNLLGVNKKAIKAIIEGWKAGDYSMAHATKLYINNGGCYCAALEILNACNYDIIF